MFLDLYQIIVFHNIALQILPGKRLSLFIIDVLFLLKKLLELVYLPTIERCPRLLPHLLRFLLLVGGGQVEWGVRGEDVRDEVTGQVTPLALKLSQLYF